MTRRLPSDPLPLSNQKPVDEDVRREIAQHIELRTEELVAEGWTATDARAEALRAFGDVPPSPKSAGKLRCATGAAGAGTSGSAP